MIYGYFTMLVALTISAIAEYYSIIGLTAIFSAAFWPIVIMGASLGVGKLTAAIWLKMNWERASWVYKFYLVPAVAVLMLLTSIGCFGYLSKAHSDQSLVSGDSMAKVAIYDEKIKVSRDNIDADRKALKQMDDAVDQVMARSDDEKGADKAVAIRRGQQKERARLLADIEAEQKKISALNEERAPLAAENRKIESEVGPIKYIAALVYGDNPDQNVLERAVRLVIIIIVLVFDPLALVLILAAQQSIRWAREDRKKDNTPVEVNKHTKAEEPPAEQLPEVPELNFWDKHPYLLNPFVHFKNLIPMPAKSEHTIMDDVAAMSIVPPKEQDVRPFTPEEITTLDNVNPNEILAVGIDVEHRPGDYVTEPAPITERVLEAAPAPNRGVMHSHVAIQADNTTDLGTPSSTGFGNEYPAVANKGDLYLRTDFLPNRLFKYNGVKWIEVDKSQTDVYAYEEQYIKHLIDEIDAGRYDLDALTDIEREQIQNYLNKNAL